MVGDAQPIYRKPIPVADGLRRIETLYQPYHAQLTALIQRARGWFGVAVLLDCHSMPSNAADVSGSILCWATDMAQGGAEIVDMQEPSLSVRIIAFAATSHSPADISPSISARRRMTSAVQIEIARALYLDERRIVRTERWPALQEDLFSAVKALALALSGNPEAGR